MARVKRGKTHLRKRKRLLKKTKGYQYGRRSKIKLARPAVLKAGVYAHRDRRNKKRLARRNWQVNINAAVRPFDLSYSRFISGLKKKGIVLNRKILKDLAVEYPNTLKKLAELVKS